MARKTLRSMVVWLTVFGLATFLSGCSLNSLSTLISAPPPAASPAPGHSGPTAVVTLMGDEIYHVFSTQENQVNFTVVPATGLPAAYVDGMGQAGQLDTSSTDPTVKSLSLVFNNPSPNDIVNITLYNHQGTVSGTIQVKVTGVTDVSSYNATSFQLTATSTDTSAPSPAPYAYLYQMTNSAGNIFTYAVPPPPA